MYILSFDIEEWFHILDNQSTRSSIEWNNYENRIHANVDRLLLYLEKNNCKATFFILGWIAEKYPEIVKKIHKTGYEIGSHSYMHQLAYSQSQKEFNADTSRSIQILEDLTGEKVRYFRAPGFSITEKNKWAFEILVELGIEIDCSVFSAKRAHGGLPSYEIGKPSILKYNGILLKELPINIYNLYGHKFVFSGGGYFRLLPYKVIKEWTKKSDYIMSYFHPRDFDIGQPTIKELPYMRKFKAYVGLKNAENKLLKWLSDFKFIDIRTANKEIAWDCVKTIRL